MASSVAGPSVDSVASTGPLHAAYTLYVVVGFTHDAVLVYSKGVLRRFAGEDYFYVLVSAKRSVED